MLSIPLYIPTKWNETELFSISLYKKSILKNKIFKFI